jgi:tripartite-type tricarboxylate transporter receptor subunit TctC
MRRSKEATMARMRLQYFSLGLAAVTSIALPNAAFAQSAEDFFKTTTLTMIVGSGAGGGYDATARVVARYLSRYLPGNPTFVIRNQPGAAGITSTNTLYNTAPKDGSTILAAANAPLVLPIYDSKVAHYDPRKFEWIGSTDKQQAVCLTWYTSPIKTLEDATKREVPVAATGLAAGPGIYPRILNTLFGTKFKIIAGYDTGGMRLAMEKGEVDGVCGLAWQTWKLTSPDWIRDKKLNVLTQFGLQKNAELPDVPLAIDQMKNAEDKKVLELIVLPQEFGRPFVAPPGVPADRMALYRKAFKAMLADPEFLAESAKQRMSIEPLDDRQIEALLDRAYAAPQAIKDRASVFAAEVQ